MSVDCFRLLITQGSKHLSYYGMALTVVVGRALPLTIEVKEVHNSLTSWKLKYKQVSQAWLGRHYERLILRESFKNKGVEFTYRGVTVNFQGQVSTAKLVLEMTASIQTAPVCYLGYTLVSFISSHPLYLSSVSVNSLLSFP